MNEQEIRDISRAYWKSEILFTANRLQIFDNLCGTPKTGKEVAKSLNIDAIGVSRLMDALVALKLLKKRGEIYSNTPAADKLLVSGKPLYLGNSILHAEIGKMNWLNLGDSIKSGKPVATEIPKKDLVWRRPLFIQAMRDYAAHTAPIIVEPLKKKKYTHLLDLGCGSGLYSKEFCEKIPTAEATLFDKPDVIDIAKGILKGCSTLKRLSFEGGDVLTHKFKKKTFDAVLVSNLLHMFGKKEIISLLKRIKLTLLEKGEVIIHDFVLNDAKTGPDFGVFFRLSMFLGTASGDNYSKAEYKEMLEKAGYKKIKFVTLSTGASLIITRP